MSYSALDRILASPGLGFLFSDILLLLDYDDFYRACRDVCPTWSRFAVEHKVWFQKLLKTAPKGSYFRFLLEERSEEYKR